MLNRLYVLVFLRINDEGVACVHRFGPTSESPSLLQTYECREPLGCVRAVLPTLGTGLLQVSQRDVDRIMKVRP